MKISFTYEFDGDDEKIMRDHWKDYKGEGETFKQFVTNIAHTGIYSYLNLRKNEVER